MISAKQTLTWIRTLIYTTKEGSRVSCIVQASFSTFLDKVYGSSVGSYCWSQITFSTQLAASWWSWTEAAGEKTLAVGLCRLTSGPAAYLNGVMKRQLMNVRGEVKPFLRLSPILVVHQLEHNLFIKCKETDLGLELAVYAMIQFDSNNLFVF